MTTHEVDPLGRITKATDPNGNITFTVYDDGNRPRGTEPTANPQTLTRSVVNAAGQAIAA